jgi:hypothetical protein
MKPNASLPQSSNQSTIKLDADELRTIGLLITWASSSGGRRVTFPSLVSKKFYLCRQQTALNPPLLDSPKPLADILGDVLT